MSHPFPKDRNDTILEAQTLQQDDPLFLDTETTGLGDDDQVCEIAVVDLMGNVLINSFVKPTIAIPEAASRIHGITNEMVEFANAPTIVDLLPQLDEILTNRTVIVYNAEYDIRMLASSLKAHQVSRAWWSRVSGDELNAIYPEPIWDLRWRDLMGMYARFYGEWRDWDGSYRWQRLGNAARQCGITLPDHIHRAHADAELARRVFLCMTEAQMDRVVAKIEKLEVKE